MGEYKRGYVIFVERYDDGDGFYGFIHPFGAKGRKQNVFFNDKTVSPAVAEVLKEGTTQRLEVQYTDEETARGVRATGVFLK